MRCPVPFVDPPLSLLFVAVPFFHPILVACVVATHKAFLEDSNLRFKRLGAVFVIFIIFRAQTELVNLTGVCDVRTNEQQRSTRPSTALSLIGEKFLVL